MRANPLRALWIFSITSIVVALIVGWGWNLRTEALIAEIAFQSGLLVGQILWQSESSTTIAKRRAASRNA